MNFDSAGVLTESRWPRICWGRDRGCERQWSGHASGPAARIGGVRTFTLLGALAGLRGGGCGRSFAGRPRPSSLAGGVGLVVAGYVAVQPPRRGGTTEVAALVTLAAGVLAGSATWRSRAA